MDGQAVIVAHRAGNLPNRAVAALGRADMIEIDVHVFRGRVEVRHAKVLWPTSRLWEKWYLLPRDIEVPTIDEILSVIPPDVPLMIDLKCFTRRAARVVRRAIPNDRTLIVSGRMWWVLGAFRDRPHTAALRSCGNRFQVRLVTLIPGLGDKTGVVAHNRLLTGEIIESLRTRTSRLFTWSVTTLERGRELVDSGVTGLIVDDLDLDWAHLFSSDDS